MKKILIVDDYPDILEGLSYILKNHYEVTTAGSLTEAKKEVSTTVFDVIWPVFSVYYKLRLFWWCEANHTSLATTKQYTEQKRENHIKIPW